MTSTTEIAQSLERRAIALKLMTRPWFRAATPDLRRTLLELPEDQANRDDWNGLLNDLADRPDSLAGVTQLRLAAFRRGNFGAIIQFEVANDAGARYTYEYFSWKHGPMSGAKGIVFVRTAGVISHFIVLRGGKFAPGKLAWDSIGGFADIGADGVVTIPDRIVLEIHEELGASDLAIEDVIDLGRIMTDAGMTNNHPGVFAAIIDARNAASVRRRPVNPDRYELKAGVFIFPMAQLRDLISRNDDAYFLAAIARSASQGLFPGEYLYGQ
jgi:hypothetical protein